MEGWDFTLSKWNTPIRDYIVKYQQFSSPGYKLNLMMEQNLRNLITIQVSESWKIDWHIKIH